MEDRIKQFIIGLRDEIREQVKIACPTTRTPIGFGFGTDFCSKVPNRKFGFGSGTDQYRTDRFRDFPKVPKSIIMYFLIFSYDYLGLREISLGHLRSPWVVRNQLEITLD